MHLRVVCVCVFCECVCVEFVLFVWVIVCMYHSYFVCFEARLWTDCVYMCLCVFALCVCVCLCFFCLHMCKCACVCSSVFLCVVVQIVIPTLLCVHVYCRPVCVYVCVL